MRVILTCPGLLRILVLRSLGQEVAGHEAADAVDLAHVEAVVVHLAVHQDGLARLEAELHLLEG